ncbi:MAG: hypothetical protein AB7D33_02515 [Sphingobium sp.]
MFFLIEDSELVNKAHIPPAASASRRFDVKPAPMEKSCGFQQRNTGLAGKFNLEHRSVLRNDPWSGIEISAPNMNHGSCSALGDIHDDFS